MQVRDVDRLVIMVGRQADGSTYALHPLSRRRLLERFPNAHPAPSIFVGYDTQEDFQRLHGPRWPQIALLLTGLTQSQMEALGGYLIYDPMNESALAEGAPRT